MEFMSIEMFSSYLLYVLPLLALVFMSTQVLFLKGKKDRSIGNSGPLSLPIIGHLYLILQKPMHRTLAKISARYSPILLLNFGPRRVLLISSPSLAEECLTANNNIFANRPRFLPGKHLGYNATMLAWAPYEAYWRNIRRIATIEIVCSIRIQQYSTYRIEEVRSLLLRRLFRNGTEFKTVNMKSMLYQLTFNLMTRLVAGKRYYGDDVGDCEKARRFREIADETLEVSGKSNVGDFLPMFRWVGAISGWEKKLLNLHERRMGFLLELIEDQRKLGTYKLKSDEKTNTVIDALLLLQETQPDYYTDQIIAGIILNLVAAGSDNPAGTMEWTLSQLLNNPEVLKKAQAEIDAVVGHGRLLEESDLVNLPYLHCIMNEIFRMYPGGPLLAPRESSEECMVGGYTIPSGTMLLVNMWAIHHDPSIWEDPHTFKPERMEGVGRGRDGFKLMPFGSGRRACPAEALAIRMIGLTLGSLIQSFEWERLGEELVDLAEAGGLTMQKSNPLEARCRPRSTMLALLSQL